MAANKPAWPKCGCSARCDKPKCNRGGGSRELQATEAAPGVGTQVAMGLASRKGAQATMKRILVAATDIPIMSAVCLKAQVSRQLIKYWLTLSRKGRRGDFFDVPIGDNRTERFHILFEDAMEAAWDKVEQKAFNLATGVEREILHHQGRVSYMFDPDLIAMGLTGADAFLIGKDGKPVPETVPLLDPEMVRWLLARRRSKDYGNKMQVDHTHKGGVLVVGVTKTSKELEASYTMKHDEIEDVEFEDVPDDAAAGSAP